MVTAPVMVASGVPLSGPSVDELLAFQMKYFQAASSASGVR